MTEKSDPRIHTLRSIFRNYHAFRSVYEDTGTQEITGPDGVVWSWWDIQKLREIAVESSLLPLRQRQAIEFFLIMNYSEKRVAEIMGIKASNPIGMYATTGLMHLLDVMDSGKCINPWKDNSMEAV